MAKVEGIRVVLRMYADEDVEVLLWATKQENKNHWNKKMFAMFSFK